MTVPSCRNWCRCGVVPVIVYGSGAGGRIFARGLAAAEDLLVRSCDPVALHGDIHYDNILDGGSRGWLVIDPKGLAGERGFDYANIFCNPDLTVAGSPERLSRQVRIVADQAGIEVRRLLCWIIAWAALSASWMLRGWGGPCHTAHGGGNSGERIGRNRGLKY